jgi:hypothetical protein
LSAVHLFLPFLLLLFCRPPSSFSTYFFFSRPCVLCFGSVAKKNSNPPLRWREASNCFTNHVFCLPNFSLSLSLFLSS